MKRQYEHLDKLLEGSDPVTTGGNGNLYDELLGEGATGYDDLLGSEISGGVVENSIYHSVDNIIKEAMRKDLSSEIMLREDFGPEEKLEKLDRLNSVTITNEHVMTYINDYIDPILEESDVEFIDGDSDGEVFPVHPMFMEMIDALDDYENGPTQTTSLEESVLGGTVHNDKVALKERLHDICESYGISDTDNQKLMLKEALTIKENVHPSWYSVSIVGLTENYDEMDENSIVENIVDNYSYEAINEKVGEWFGKQKDKVKKGVGRARDEVKARRMMSGEEKGQSKDRAKKQKQMKKTAKSYEKADNNTPEAKAARKAAKREQRAEQKKRNTINKAALGRRRYYGDKVKNNPKKAAGAAAGAAALGAAGAYAYKKYKDKKKKKEATNEAANFMLSHALCCSDETVMEQVVELANHWKSLVK